MSFLAYFDLLRVIWTHFELFEAILTVSYISFSNFYYPPTYPTLPTFPVWSSYGQAGPKCCKRSSPSIGLFPRNDVSSRLTIMIDHAIVQGMTGSQPSPKVLV